MTTTTFEAAGAAQVRLLEAERRLALAEGHLQAGGNGLLDALSEAAWAHERAGTVSFWLRIAEDLPEGQPLAQRGVRDAARDALTTSGEEVAYVRAVFATRGIQVDLGEPEARLLEAEEAFDRGFHSAAMFTAIEAGVRASVLLEIVGYPAGLPEAKFEQKRAQAALAIQAARERGIEPFLAQSQYEFGLSLEAPADRLAFLGLSRVSANLAGLPGLFAEPRAAQSRFVGEAPSLGVAPTWVAAAFAVGLALGAGTGLLALMPRDEKDAPQVVENEAPPSPWPPSETGPPPEPPSPPR
jgi:predicted S18 family serine protease